MSCMGPGDELWQVDSEVVVNLPTYLGGRVRLRITGMSESYGAREYHAVTVPDGEVGGYGYEAFQEGSEQAQGEAADRVERDDAEEASAGVRAQEGLSWTPPWPAKHRLVMEYHLNRPLWPLPRRAADGGS